MKQADLKGKSKKKKVDLHVNSKSIILCKYCEKKIDKVKMLGLSLICPSCGKPQN
jgi:hypothetical protein